MVPGGEAVLEEMLQRQRRVLRLIALAYALAAAFGVLALFTPGGGVAVMFLFYSSPLGVLALAVWRSGWLIGSGRALLRKAAAHGEPWAVLRAIDAEADAVWVGERATWRFWSLPRFALVTPGWLVQTDPDGVTLLPLADVIWVFRRQRHDMASWGVH